MQPHAGSQTNMAVYAAVLQPGDTILSLRLDHGGHLTHGHKVNFSGRLYTIAGYGVSRETMMVDYDEVLAPGEGGTAEADRLRRLRVSAHRRDRQVSARSPTRSVRSYSATWRTSPGSSPRGCTQIQSSTATSSHRRRTRRWQVRAQASSSAVRSMRRQSIAQSSRACRAARSSTRSRRRRRASRSR